MTLYTVVKRVTVVLKERDNANASGKGEREVRESVCGRARERERRIQTHSFGGERNGEQVKGTREEREKRRRERREAQPIDIDVSRGRVHQPPRKCHNVRCIGKES